VHLYLSEFCLEREMFQAKFVKRITTRIFMSSKFFSENRVIFSDNVRKYISAGDATFYNTARANFTQRT